MITLNDVKDQEFEVTKKYIEPGIHEVKITGIEYPEVENDKSTYLLFTWENREGLTAVNKFYLSEKAKDFSLPTIKHIAGAITTQDKINSISALSYKEFATKLFNTIGNKFYRQKFNGEEVLGKKGVWNKATVGFLTKTNPLAESLFTKESESVLRFDPNNSFDFKRLGSSIEIKPTVLDTSNHESIF